MDEGTLKTTIPKCRLYWSFLFRVVKQFCRFQNFNYKTPAEYGLQHNSTPPHTLSVYAVHLGREGAEVRAKVEAQKYRSKFTSWVENTNHEWMYLHSIKSVKDNAAKSVNRSIFKEKPMFGVFIVHSSMASGPHQLPSHFVAALITTTVRFWIHSFLKVKTSKFNIEKILGLFGRLGTVKNHDGFNHVGITAR